MKKSIKNSYFCCIVNIYGKNSEVCIKATSVQECIRICASAGLHVSEKDIGKKWIKLTEPPLAFRGVLGVIDEHGAAMEIRIPGFLPEKLQVPLPNSSKQPKQSAQFNPKPSPDLLLLLDEEGYSGIRMLNGEGGAGGWNSVLCGLTDFAFTAGLVVGLHLHGYQRRYCYEKMSDAAQALDKWDGNGHPDGPWIKCKGVGIDLLNPSLNWD